MYSVKHINKINLIKVNIFNYLTEFFFYLILVYRTQTNSPISSNPNTNLYISSTPTNSLNKPTISQQRSSYLQQGRVINNNSMDSSYPIQQNGYGQYPIHHQQQSRFIFSFLI
jgi:hypothetical protein